MSLRFRVEGLGFRVSGLVYVLWGLCGFRVSGVELFGASLNPEVLNREEGFTGFPWDVYMVFI